MKDSLYLASMLRRFAREKEELRKRNPNMVHLGLSGSTANKPHSGDSAKRPLAPASTQPQDNATGNDLSLADLTSDPAVMSLLGSANEKQLQDLLGDLDFGLLDNDQQHAVVTARENGILGVGVPSSKAAAAAAVGGGGPGRGLGSTGGLFSPPPLPEGLPAPLIKRIEDLRAVSQCGLLTVTHKATRHRIFMTVFPVRKVSCKLLEKCDFKLNCVGFFFFLGYVTKRTATLSTTSCRAYLLIPLKSQCFFSSFLLDVREI